MFACSMLLHKYMKSLGNDVHNLSGNMHVRREIYQEFYPKGIFVVFK